MRFEELQNTLPYEITIRIDFKYLNFADVYVIMERD